MADEDFSLADIVQSPSAPNSLTPTVLPSEAIVVPAEEMVDDRIIAAVKLEESEDTVLHAVIYSLAEEQQSLKNLREKKYKEGKDTSNISLKRGTLLKYLSDTLIQKKSMTGPVEEFDLRGPKFREIFKMFLEVISDTFDEVKIAPEYKEMFFSALAHNLDGWEERAEKIAKSVDPRRQVG